MLQELEEAPNHTDADRIAAGVMSERLQVSIDHYEAGERLRDLRIIGSPVGSVRSCFDLMATGTDDDWEIIAARMERVPAALAGYQDALRLGIERETVAARRGFRGQPRLRH